MNWLLQPVAILTYAIMAIIVYILVSTMPANPQPMDLVRYVKEPPWQYDYPYRGQLTVKELLPHEVHDECTRGFPAPKGRLVMACALLARDESECIVILPINIGQFSHKEMRLLVRHEIAHCNGWPDDHSDGLKVKQ